MTVAKITINGEAVSAEGVQMIRAALSDYRDRIPAAKKATALEKAHAKRVTSLLQQLGY